MRVTPTRRNERGVAIVLAVFALILITAMALAMLFASDTETNISINYRDKQVAIYGAIAGLQEARDRIHLVNGDLGTLGVVPSVLPSQAAPGSVLYITNNIPGGQEPWVPTLPGGAPNPYYDTELCQENLTGFTPAPGNPCSLPGGTWHGGQSAWAVSSPLSWKWVRVTLKSSNMTPVWVTGATTLAAGTTGPQVCFDGRQQQQKPDKLPTTCAPPPNSGPVTHIGLTNFGSGYDPDPTKAPHVAIAGDGGGAWAIAHVGPLPSGVTSVTLTNAGTGYTTTPNIVVQPVDGNGSGAVVRAVMGGGVPIKGVNFAPAATPACYQSGQIPSVSIDTSFGSGAQATATVTSATKCVYSFTANGQCTAEKNNTVNVSASGGFTGTITFDKHGNIAATRVTNPGNYSSLPAASAFTVQGCDSVTVGPQGGTHIQQVTVVPGQGGSYVQPPDVSFSGAFAAAGSGPDGGQGILDGTPTAGIIKSLTLVAGGNGYTVDPQLVIDPPCNPSDPTCKDTPAQGTASIAASNGVISIECCGNTPPGTTTTGGNGYTWATVTIDPPPPGGTPATAVASTGKSAIPQQPTYLLTAFAETVSGARAMAQMEVALQYSKWSFNLGGALTLAGPSPTLGSPNAMNFAVDGNDGNSCGETPVAAKPAIGVYDDPAHPTDPTALASVIAALGKPENYIGAHSAPDVENAFSALGSPDETSGLNAIGDAVKDIAQNLPNSYFNASTSDFDHGRLDGSGKCIRPAMVYVNGNASMGPQSGCGILFVTGTLTFSGNYDWKGLIFIVGQGAAVMNGGGNGLVTGALFVANTSGGVLGSPSAVYSGGGTNSIQYDHCYADNFLNKLKITPPINPSAYQILSMRNIEY